MRIIRNTLIVLFLTVAGTGGVAVAAFPNAWQITDSSTAMGSVVGYSTNLLAAQSTAATNTSFRYTVAARLVDDLGGTESLGLFYSVSTNRFSVFLDLDAGGNLIALFPTNGGPTATLTLTTNTIGARGYHTHEIVYSNSTKVATYSFDGTALRTWSGDGSTGEVGQVFWGAASDAGQGQANFRFVRFQINNTNVVIYDAGSSITNRPVPPDPVSRGWTFSSLGIDTATNAVAPDTFWNPTITLNGANPLQATWMLPFNDPGVTVIGSPVSVDAGRFHSLALKADGTVAGWGGFSGGTNLPASITNVIALASGDAHSIALKAGSALVAWGDNSLGQTDIPASATNLVGVAAGLNHSIGLRADGTVLQWGDDAAITNAPASATNVVAVAAGQYHNLVLRSNGTVVAWGFATGQTNIPVSATNLVAIAAGTHSLGLRSTGAVIAWGDNSFNQTNVPAAASNVIAIAAGLSHCLALRSNGTVVAWGAGTNNTGVAPRFGQAIVPANATNVIAIAAGDYHSLALRADGTVIAWGAGTNVAVSPHFGQSIVPGDLRTIQIPVTTNGSVNSSTPGNYLLTYLVTNAYNAVALATRTVTVVQLYPGVVTLPASMTNSAATIRAAVNPNGFATTAWFEWGLGSRFDQRTSAVTVGNGSSPVVINAGLNGLTPGLVYRCRIVASNSVGLGARCYDVAFLAPTSVTLIGANPLTNVWGLPYVEPGVGGMGSPVAVAGGRVHCLALKADGTVTGWGDNFYGQAGSPSNATNFVALVSGQHYNLGATAAGAVVAWGDNSFGQLNVPASATNAVALAAGDSHGLALRANGTLVGWGDDSSGQSAVPISLTNVAVVAAGQRHSLAVKVNGDLFAWGYNGFGQTDVPLAATNNVAAAGGAGHSLALRGDGTVLVWGLNSYYQSNLPATATNVIAIAAGFYHSLALRADGTVVAWGAGTNNTGAVPHFGQSIVPPSATNVVAIAAGYYHSLAIRLDGSVIAWGAGTASSGSFPNLGQSIAPTDLSTLVSLPAYVSGTVNTTQEGGYPLGYTPINPFGGVGSDLLRTVFVTAPPLAPLLTGFTTLGNGAKRFGFTNTTPTSFTVYATTNLALPAANWILVGPATQVSPGSYEFTDNQSTNLPQRFYQVRSP